MLNNFTGGGQVFLHKIRMLRQVFSKSFWISFLISSLVIFSISYEPSRSLDFSAAITYQKALFADYYDDAAIGIRTTINPKNKYNYTRINAFDKQGIYARDIDPRNIIRSSYFNDHYNQALEFMTTRFVMTGVTTIVIFIIIFVLWSRFGLNLKEEKTKDGDIKILTAKQVQKALTTINKNSDLTIGEMPLVKDTETRHFLVTGSTGSGKTNLMHNILPQIEKKSQPAIVIDNTGEMISKYYNESRGDIIFNPFDERGQAWDFWSDCSNPEELERFSKILFGFNRKYSSSNSDPFWEQSAELVFNSCVEYLVNRDLKKMSLLKKMVCNARINELQNKLKGTIAERYLNDEGRGVASSVLSTLSTTAKPINYLLDYSEAGLFSLKKYFQDIKQGSNQWIFLATKPSSRQLTQSLIACITELSLTQLMDIGIDNNRRVWFIIDELASLGRLPALPTLMSEGRKYGSCIMCGLQSLNQLYSIYGQYQGSSIFGQFGTSFFFRNIESLIARQVSDMSGYETITRQQKNTSFGANEFRDGISYNEHQLKKPLIEPSDLSSLDTGNCYVFLPDPKVRIAKIKAPYSDHGNVNDGFIPREEVRVSNNSDINTSQENHEENKTADQKAWSQFAFPNQQKNNPIMKNNNQSKSKTHDLNTTKEIESSVKSETQQKNVSKRKEIQML